MFIIGRVCCWTAARIISKPGRIHVTRVTKIKGQVSGPGEVLKEGNGVTRKENNAVLHQHGTGIQVGTGLCVSGKMLPSLCCSQVKKKTHYQLQLQDARRKKERKRAAISAARHENKPTEKSALMSKVYAAGCVGWILPHPLKGRG